MCGPEYEWHLFGCESERCNFYVIVCLLSSKLIFSISALPTVKCSVMYSSIQNDTFVQSHCGIATFLLLRVYLCGLVVFSKYSNCSLTIHTNDVPNVIC